MPQWPYVGQADVEEELEAEELEGLDGLLGLLGLLGLDGEEGEEGGGEAVVGVGVDRHPAGRALDQERREHRAKGEGRREHEGMLRARPIGCSCVRGQTPSTHHLAGFTQAR